MPDSLQACFARYPDSDKGTLHAYLDTYAAWLEPTRMTVRAVLELGVRFGGSLQAWRDYFPQAVIVGLDNGEECGLWTPADPRIVVRWAEARQPATLVRAAQPSAPYACLVARPSCRMAIGPRHNASDNFRLANRPRHADSPLSHASRPAPYDLIVDDASHRPLEQVAAWAALSPLLAPGGRYVLEDVQSAEAAEAFVAAFGGEVIDLTASGRYDDRLVSWRWDDGRQTR